MLLSYFRRTNKLNALSVLTNKHLILLIALNGVIMVLYSTINIYRLPIFILIHLFIMCFYDHNQPIVLESGNEFENTDDSLSKSESDDELKKHKKVD